MLKFECTAVSTMRFYGIHNMLSILILIVAITTCCSAKKPSVLLIIVDDLRPALGAYSDPNAHTPNIDALAQKSFVFMNAFAQQALCAPSRNSLLTSRRPDSLHLYDVHSYWRKSVGNFTTLPQVFRDNGYSTISIGKVFHPGISSGNDDDAPFSWTSAPYHPSTQKYKDEAVCLTRSGRRASNLNCPVMVEEQPSGTLPDIQSAERAVSVLRKMKSDRALGEKQPFFLAVGFHKPHIPLKFPQQYLEYHPDDMVVIPRNHYRSAMLPMVAWAPWNDVRKRDDIAALNLTFPFTALEEPLIREITRNYAAATTYIDDLVGEVLAEIDNNTIVVLTSDHGWSLGEHGEFGKYSNFDVATHVPLIVHVPGLNDESMVTVPELTELVDLFPTLIDLTAVTNSVVQCSDDNVELCTEGVSLAPLMLSKVNKSFSLRRQKNAAFSQYPRPSVFPSRVPDSDQPKLQEIKLMGYSIRTDNYRYTEWLPFNPVTFKPDWRNAKAKELYDHSIDPSENLNLADRNELIGVRKLLHKKLKMGWRHAYECNNCQGVGV